MSARRAALLCCSGALCVIGAVFALAPQRAIVTHVEIAAPPAKVWAALTDATSYPQWNPDIRLSGRLEPGRVIAVLEGRGADAVVFHPVVLVARAPQELRWLGHIWLPRVFDAEHYFLFEAAGGGTRLTQGVMVRGVALWLFDLQQLVPSFDLVNAQIKKRAERTG